MTFTRKVILLTAVFMLAVGSTSFAKGSRSSGDAWMGVYTQTVDRELARAFNLKSEQGVVINKIVDDSPADRAGLKEEDVIIGANGGKIETSDDLTDLVDGAKPGDKVTLDVIREGKEMQLAMTLGDRDENKERNFSWTAPRAPMAPMTPIPPVNMSFNLNGRGTFIGVQLTDLSEQLGDYFGVKNGNGVLVSDVDRDSPAEKTGIKAGDVIVAIDGEKISDSRDVQDLIQDRKAGTTASIDILRDHKPLAFKVEVEKRRQGNFFGYSYGHGNTVVTLPRMHGLNFGSDDGDDMDNTELQAQLEDLNAKMADMKDRMKDDKELQEQIRQLKEELKELKTKLH